MNDISRDIPISLCFVYVYVYVRYGEKESLSKIYIEREPGVGANLQGIYMYI